MSLPFFYSEESATPGATVTLDETTSRHVIQVLRMKKGDQLLLTNGKGKKWQASIVDQVKRNCVVQVGEETEVAQSSRQITIAVSLLKNTSRFEWFLEKATELGIHTIVPVICDRTERTHFRFDRMKNILVSAMLQSQQCWLPEMPEPVSFKQWVTGSADAVKLIAHCMDLPKTPLSAMHAELGNKSICIGPEGDFTDEELSLALDHQFKPVSLGSTRLRTETAALVAAVLLAIQ